MAVTDDGSSRAVIKFGGEIVAQTPRLMALCADLAELHRDGWDVLVCHGGGPQANALADRLGVSTIKVGGRRITDAATLEVMKYILAGQVSVDICAAAAAVGLRAVGIAGVSGPTVAAHRRPPKIVSGGGPDPIDFGLVGDVDQVHTELIEHLWRGGYVPVLNSLGIDPQAPLGRPCSVYNINADTVASAVAAALHVDHLFLVTDVPGILRDRRDSSTRIERMTAAQASAAIGDGTIVGGMIPKVEEALSHLARGIKAVHILGAEPGGLRAEAVTPGACGTVLCR